MPQPSQVNKYGEPVKTVQIFTNENPAPKDHYCKWCGYRGGNYRRPAGEELVGTRCPECKRIAEE
jgi:hypothetical protein